MAANLKPLDQYVEENKDYMNDPTVASYLFTRCAAFYTFVAAITIKKNEKLADKFTAYSTGLSVLNAKHMMKQFDHTAEDAFKSTQKTFEKMAEYYKEDGQEFFAKTGSYIEGTPLQGDLGVCSKIVNMTQ